MLRTGRVLVAAALLVLLAGKVHAQKPGTAAATLPEVPLPLPAGEAPPTAKAPAALAPPVAVPAVAAPAASEAQATADWGPVTGGPPPWAVPPQGTVPYEDANGPLLKGDPLLDGPPYAPPGWLAAVDVDPVWPHIKNHLSAQVGAGPVTDQVQLPTADLGVTVSPRFEAGYRLAQGAGELLASYRFVEASGSAALTPFGPGQGAGDLRSRLDMNVLDLDYGSRELSLGPKWDMQWLAGVRLASLYFDSQAAGAGVAQRETNDTRCAGPKVALELWRCLDESGVSLYTRLDGAFLVGRIRQRFTEDFAAPGPGGGETDQSVIQGMPMLSAQAGLGWKPCGSRHLRFAAGYTWERWWDVGAVPGSHAEIWVQGVFLRGEWRY